MHAHALQACGHRMPELATGVTLLPSGTSSTTPATSPPKICGMIAWAAAGWLRACGARTCGAPLTESRAAYGTLHCGCRGAGQAPLKCYATLWTQRHRGTAAVGLLLAHWRMVAPCSLQPRIWAPFPSCIRHVGMAGI